MANIKLKLRTDKSDIRSTPAGTNQGFQRTEVRKGDRTPLLSGPSGPSGSPPCGRCEAAQRKILPCSSAARAAPGSAQVAALWEPAGESSEVRDDHGDSKPDSEVRQAQADVEDDEVTDAPVRFRGTADPQWLGRGLGCSRRWREHARDAAVRRRRGICAEFADEADPLPPFPCPVPMSPGGAARLRPCVSCAA